MIIFVKFYWIIFNVFYYANSNSDKSIIMFLDIKKNARCIVCKIKQIKKEVIKLSMQNPNTWFFRLFQTQAGPNFISCWVHGGNYYSCIPWCRFYLKIIVHRKLKKFENTQIWHLKREKKMYWKTLLNILNSLR